jgi:hypothetical protein
MKARCARPPSPVNEILVLRDVVRDLELHGPRLVTVEELSRSYGIKRRSLFDVISICAVFGICHRPQNNSIEWLGLGKSADALGRLREQAVAESDGCDLLCLFDCSAEPSLPRIAQAVIRLFFCLAVRHLDLRKVAKLFGQGKTKYKTMLRKLYTVVQGLELAGIVTRTSVVSEIKLSVPLQGQSAFSQFALSSILNTEREANLAIGREKKRKEFDQISVAAICHPMKTTLSVSIGGIAHILRI